MDTGLALFAIGLLIFCGIVYIVLKGRREWLDVGPGYLLVRAGIRLDPMSPSRRAKAWRAYGYASLIILIVSGILFYYYTGKLFILKYIHPPPCKGAIVGFVPFIPGVTMSWTATLYIGVAIGIAALFHELSHAYVARSIGVKIKDAGLAFFLFIPAAFVEPDDEELSKARRRDRALVYSAGVGANALLAIIFLVIATGMIAGVAITGVEKGSPADQYGLKPGMKIIEVNGTRVGDIGDLTRILTSIGVGDPHKNVTVLFKVEYNGETMNIIVHRPGNKSAGPCDRGRIGILVTNTYYPSRILGVLSYISFLINISLAVVNAAPLVIPLPGGSIFSDGAYILKDALSSIMDDRRATMVTIAIGAGTLLLIISLLSLQRIM